jgi:16S rRNA (cytosine967-C5)-methyltransferase
VKRRAPKAANARVRAVEALRKVLESGRPAAPLVGELARGLSPPDADLLRELVLGVLRWKNALDAEIAAVSRIPLRKLAPNLREILEVALYQLRHLDRIPPYAAVSEAVTQARGSGGEGASKLVNGVLRGILLLPEPVEPAPGARAEELARFYSHPPFLVERWVDRFGADATRRVLAADNTAPRLDLLANPRRTTRDALLSALAAEGVRSERSEMTPLGLTVSSGNALATRAFSQGQFSVQDLGAQVLPLLLPPGDLLVDLAAAPGGKSLSALAHGRARRTLALDASLPRLLRVSDNSRRLQAAATPVAADLESLPLSKGRFERVLLDAPCTGTGTLRKNPEIRYRVTSEAIERLAARQERWLAAAAALLAPGGRLLYSTCSLEPEENERVVERVCAGTDGLAPEPIDPPPGLAAFVEGARLRLLPDDRVDGFTAHLLRRAGPAPRSPIESAP